MQMEKKTSFLMSTTMEEENEDESISSVQSRCIPF